VLPQPPRWSPLSLPHAALRQVVRRETVRLVVLIAVAAATIVLTRSVAAISHRLERREAAEWYGRGVESLSRGDPAAAVGALRRAAAAERGNRTYALTLGGALAAAGQTAAAERVLLAIRADHPEDPEINLALADAARRRSDVTAAVRYYRNALYAPWPGAEGPRAVRMELVDLLLAHGDNRTAIAELIAATTDLPATAAAHGRVGELFARAGDQRRALEQFQRALEIDAGSKSAQLGAGRAALAIGDYSRARRHLVAAGDDGIAPQLAAVAAAVLERDPLASRISTAERRRRVIANVEHARTLLDTCLSPQAPDAAEPLRAQLDALPIGRRGIARDADVLETAVSLVARIASRAETQCSPPAPLDRALVLIARHHGIAEP
jgi:tetratricopeptide (TPR) repeat protein